MILRRRTAVGGIDYQRKLLIQINKPRRTSPYTPRITLRGEEVLAAMRVL